MSALTARRCLVSGIVQGVFFRASTRQKAVELSLTGYAINLPDGRVEVLMVGDSGAVEALTTWLHRGPPAARVEAVQKTEVSLEEIGDVPVGFSTR